MKALHDEQMSELKAKYETATSQLDRSIKKTKFLEEELKSLKNKELGYGTCISVFASFLASVIFSFLPIHFSLW